MAALLGLPALVVLAPAAAAVRAVRRARRGDRVRLSWREEPASGALARLAVELDVPTGREPRARRALTDAVVRIAEALRRPDDVYHLLWRERHEHETTLLPIGPQVQDLGERFHLALSHHAWAGRTLVWLTLARSTPLASAVPAADWNPEAPGEPAGLLAAVPARWAAALEFRSDGASTLHRLDLHLPPSKLPQATALLARLESAAQTGEP